MPTGPSSVLFFDPVCQKPYDTRSVREYATAGTEASVVRVADALGATVMQHNRTTPDGRYRPPGKLPGIEHVVVIRDSRALPAVHALYPEARKYLWVHHFHPPSSKLFRRLAATAESLRRMAVTIVCVSQEHRREMNLALQRLDLQDELKTCAIYNPIDDDLVPDGSPIDDSKLVFFSSPNKGLKFTLDAFRELHRRMPELRLVVGNPGYKIRSFGTMPGVTWLEPQPQWAIHAEVRTALCVFYPNFTFPETFGMVFAEAKALGTPTLAHPCGAAAEVISDPAQIIPVAMSQRLYESAFGLLRVSWRRIPARIAAYAGLFDCYVDRIQAWRSGHRPVTAPDSRFQLSTVTGEWRKLLQG